MASSEGRRAVVAYFGPDLDDPVVRRRVGQWRYAGFTVLPLAFSRNSRSTRQAAEEFINLGRVMPLSRARRVLPLLRAALRLLLRRKALSAVDLFIARNLDIALLALFARRVAGSTAPLIYEVLDINVSCTAAGWRGALVRRIERYVLAATDLLVVSSPHFATAYYEGLQRYRRSWFLFENKVPKWIEALPPAAPASPPSDSAGARRWRIGWFGYLDDERSWKVLRSVAEALPAEVAIHVRGTPYTNFDMERFLVDVERLDNVTYGGPYRNPEDLASVYGSVDIVWSMDFNFPAANSKWLLTNALYEAGYFGKPVLGLVGTAVGQWLAAWHSGWSLSEPVEAAVIEFIRALDSERYAATCRRIAQLSPDVFVESDEIERIWATLQSQKLRHGVHAAPRRVQPIH